MNADKATYTIRIHPEDMPVRGNAIASGDDDFDKKVEDELIERLDNGDLWAWCCVEVVAEYGGFTGSAYLGGCSYKDEQDFAAGGYNEDMKDEAREALEDELRKAAEVAADYFA